MSRITSLKIEKEVSNTKKKEIAWDKFKIDITIEPKKLMALLLKKFNGDIPKDLSNSSVESISTMFNKGLKHFRVEFYEVSEATNSRALRLMSKKARSRGLTPKAYKFNIYKNNELCEMDKNLYTIPSIKFSSSTLSNIYYSFCSGSIKEDLHPFTKAIDFEYLWSLLRCIEYFYEYLMINNDIVGNKDSSFFGLEYTSSDIENLLNLKYLEGRRCYFDRRAFCLILDCIINIAYIQSSLKLNAKYSKKLDSDYAKSYETKKNIPQKQLDIMETSEFLKDFSFVELDELTDISKFRVIEKEFQNAKKQLDLEKYLEDNKAELRFRRLGNHKASGLYYPALRCVCIDINSPSSFIHEIGHHIDHTNGELSLKHDFMFIAMEYQKQFNLDLESCEDGSIIDYCKRKKDYFFTPTEIFARCLEIYLSKFKGVKSSFIDSVDKMDLRRGYPTVSGKLEGLLTDYYSNLFTIDCRVDTTISKEVLNAEQTPLEKASLLSKDVSIRSITKNVDTNSKTNDVSSEKSFPPTNLFELLNEPIQTKAGRSYLKRKRVRNSARSKSKLSDNIQLSLI